MRWSVTEPMYASIDFDSFRDCKMKAGWESVKEDNNDKEVLGHG